MLRVLLSLALGFACQVLGGPKDMPANKTGRVKLAAAVPVKVGVPSLSGIRFEQLPADVEVPGLSGIRFERLPADVEVPAVLPSTASVALRTAVDVPAMSPSTARSATPVDVSAPETKPLVATATYISALPSPIYDAVVFRYANPGVSVPALSGLDLSPVVVSAKAPSLARLSAEARPTVADPFDSPVPLWKAGYLYGLRKQAVAAKTAGDLEAYASFRLLYLQQLGNILQRHELFVDGAKVRSGGRRQ